MSAGRSTNNSDLPLHLPQLTNVHYDGSVPWMLIPDDKRVLHTTILSKISPPVTRNVAADVKLNLYTKYVQFISRSSKLKLNGCPVCTKHVTKLLRPRSALQLIFDMGTFPNTSNMFQPACSVLPTVIPTAGTSVDKVTAHLATCL